MKDLKRKITLTDIWKSYPYKKRKGGILQSEGINHFPKKEIIDNHTFSIDITEFKRIADEISKERLSLLLDGKKVKLPLRSGYLELKKYRSQKSIDWQATNNAYGEYNKTAPKGQKRFIYHKNYHTQGYKPLLKWDKRTSVMKNKQIFMIRFTRDVNRYIAKLLKDQPLTINNLNSV